jgi:hypothetical protein
MRDVKHLGIGQEEKPDWLAGIGFVVVFFLIITCFVWG